jgi:hypothetical protein
MSPIPVVSFVMSVRDGERYLAAAIDSVLEQSFTDFELVVIDDGSTDSSPRILDEYASSDARVLVHRHENVGLVTSLNRGVAYARSALIARLDADDVARPDRLERQVGYLMRHPEVGLVGGAAVFIDETGRAFAEGRYPAGDAEIRDAFSTTTPFVHSAVTMRREVFDAAGGYRAAFLYAEDLDLWLRIGAVSRLANLDETVVSYRIHSQQITVMQLEQQSLSTLGARVASQALAQGRPDPFAEAMLVDRQALLAAGASTEDMAREFVQLAVWLAKTLSRAGQADAAADLFGEAEARARSDSGSRALVSSVEVARERVRRR